MKLTRFLFLVAALSLNIIAPIAFAQDAKQKAMNQPASVTDAARMARLDMILENLRQELKIPALSAAIVKDQKVVWAKGFGYADVENKIPATEHTSYHLASLTKTFASTILMQLVQEGKINLDDPVSKYGITLESNGVIRVKHLFSHTSEGNPGERYSYNGNRFGELDKVIRKATGKSFAELLIANILDPLDMKETAPNIPNILKTKSPAGTDQKMEDEVKAALTSLLAGFSAGNVDQIEKYFAPELNSFPRDGGLLTAFADLARLRGWYRTGLKLTFDIHDLEAAVYGNTALTTCIINGTTSFPGDPLRKEGPWRASYIWNKQSGAWKLVHAHESLLEGSLITERHQQRFDAISKMLAQPYALDKSNIVKSAYPTHFSASAGLISSVLDMAKYDIAIDQNRFLKKETQQLAFTPTVSTKGETLPYGLGWFTQNYKGTRLIWHYGYWTCNSSLILKVPDRNITFIAMANTDNLSRPTDLGAGDVTSSPVGLAFLKTFVFPEMFGESLPEINWQAPSQPLKDQLKLMTGKPYADLYTKELIVQTRMLSSVGKTDDASRLFQVYGDMYLKKLPEDLLKKTAIAEIIRVKDDEDKTVEFSLPRTQSVRIFAIGEGQGGAMFDYGWIESLENGKPVWEMKVLSTEPAGGAGKNLKVDTVITLPAGKYKLRYKSDDSHSFDNWNSLPPEINFWGIALYAQEG
jgi:CubicO group peptidase (beta-lactamase class C family)